MRKQLWILLIILGGIFIIPKEMHAQEDWLKILNQSEQTINIGWKFDISIPKDGKNDGTSGLDIKFLNHYVGFNARVWFWDMDDFHAVSSIWYGYGFNLGNIYEIADKADNIPHKIFKRVNIVPTLNYVWSDYMSRDGYGKNFKHGKAKLVMMVDVNLVRYMGAGLNIQYARADYTKYGGLG